MSDMKQILDTLLTQQQMLGAVQQSVAHLSDGQKALFKKYDSLREDMYALHGEFSKEVKDLINNKFERQEEKCGAHEKRTAMLEDFNKQYGWLTKGTVQSLKKFIVWAAAIAVIMGLFMWAGVKAKYYEERPGSRIPIVTEQTK
jgi:DNA repair ATPase RecN